MIGHDDDPVVVVTANQWLALADKVGKITGQRDRLLEEARFAREALDPFADMESARIRSG